MGMFSKIVDSVRPSKPVTKEDAPHALGTGTAAAAAKAITSRRTRLQQAEEDAVGKKAGGVVRADAKDTDEYRMTSPAGRNVHEGYADGGAVPGSNARRRYSGKEVASIIRSNESIRRHTPDDRGGVDFNQTARDSATWARNTARWEREKAAALKQDADELGSAQPILDARQRALEARSARVGAGRGEVNPPRAFKAGGMVRRGYGKARGC
jgi:hypothetical protein